ncbi:hypothetical protein D3C71_1213240 [compost metagenome]
MQGAGGRQEATVGVFGIQARFQRMAADLQLVLLQGQRLPAGHAQLPFHQVGAGDALGDRVFNLQAGVHFHEEEIAVRRGDELHRAGADVVDRARGIHRGLAHRRAPLGGHAGGGGFFQHLLVTALHRAVALEQVDHVAVTVAEHLDLDMARALDILLHQHMRSAERRLCLALAAGQRVDEVRAGIHPAHALATATGAGLDQDRVADRIGLGTQELRRLVLAVVARREGHAGLLHQRLGRALVAHRADRIGRGADEDDAGFGTGLGEAGVLGQEAVAGMDRLRAGAACGLQDGIPAQVALACRRRADRDGLVGQAHVARVAVGVGVHRHGGDAQALAGSDDTAGNFAAVGDQDLGEHGGLVARANGGAGGGTWRCRACLTCGTHRTRSSWPAR